MNHFEQSGGKYRKSSSKRKVSKKQLAALAKGRAIRARNIKKKSSQKRKNQRGGGDDSLVSINHPVSSPIITPNKLPKKFMPAKGSMVSAILPKKGHIKPVMSSKKLSMKSVTLPKKRPSGKKRTGKETPKGPWWNNRWSSWCMPYSPSESELLNLYVQEPAPSATSSNATVQVDNKAKIKAAADKMKASLAKKKAMEAKALATKRKAQEAKAAVAKRKALAEKAAVANKKRHAVVNSSFM